jgi:HD-like signal output (HDOD) protein
MTKDPNLTWYNLEKELSLGASKALKSSSSLDGIPFLPSALLDILSFIDTEDCSAEKIGTKLRKLPTIAHKTLELANLYNLNPSQNISSLEHAVGYLGHSTFKSVLLISFLKTLKPKSKHFNSEKFWFDSFLTGLIAEKLANKLGTEFRGDVAFLAGSLANIGKFILASYVDSEFDKVYKSFKDEPIGTLWEEHQVKSGLHSLSNYGEIASGKWGLDEDIKSSIVNLHKKPDKDEKAQLHHIVSMANQIMHWVNCEPDLMNEELMYEQAEKISISSNEIESFVESIQPLKDNLEKKLAS